MNSLLLVFIIIAGIVTVFLRLVFLMENETWSIKQNLCWLKVDFGIEQLYSGLGIRFWLDCANE